MKLPKIKSFGSAQEYLSHLYLTNKAVKKSFSHRSFAKKMNWPSSYLSDVIKGRKKLTISRSLQFAEAFKLSPAETEYLVTLCLADFDDQRVSSYFKEELAYKNLNTAKKASFKNYLILFRNIRTMYLRELILWGQGKVKLTDLLTAQIPFPELHKEEVLREALDFLAEKNMISEISDGTYQVKEGNFFALDDEEYTVNNPKEMATHYVAKLEVLTRLYVRYTGNGFSFSGYIDILVERYPEVQKRMFELRDWLISLSKEKKSLDLQKNDTFQLELHLLPMFDFKNSALEARHVLK